MDSPQHQRLLINVKKNMYEQHSSKTDFTKDTPHIITWKNGLLADVDVRFERKEDGGENKKV